jgi:hypothetical protein
MTEGHVDNPQCVTNGQTSVKEILSTEKPVTEGQFDLRQS